MSFIRFYHRVEYHDMNQDGRKDIVTCRTHVSRKTLSQLVWLQPKDVNDPLGPWEANVLSQDCDVYFRIRDLDGDGIPEIVAAQFFKKQLNLLYTDHPDGRWDMPQHIHTRVIDSNMGAAYDVMVRMPFMMCILESTKLTLFFETAARSMTSTWMESWI